ncbi:MAG: cell wall hydrolase [Lachnospiraceae bacterium]|nr:cell wall hydrolase [Lachnospiraceae bacterium]
MKKMRRIVAMIVLVSVTAGAFPVSSYASTTQQKIDKTEKEKNELEGKLDDKQDELEKLKGQQSSLKGQLSNLNSELTEVSNNLTSLENQIAVKEQEIVDTQVSLEQARQTEVQQYASMKTRIRYMYESGEKSYIEAFFSAENLAEFLNAADYFERIAEYDRMMLDDYEANRQFIETEEARLQNEKIELDGLKQQAENEKSRVSGLINKTSRSISQYAEQISDAEAQALAYEAEIKKKEQDLKTLKKKLAEEIAISQAAAQGQWRDISEVTFEESDRKLLANLIYCEAGGEPYEGQVAVGAVVINRLLSAKFPNTIVGVIYQNRQFSPVASGRLELALAQDKATEKCYRAADEAMSGVTNVGNCLFFRTPIEGLTGISIGGHIFY